MAINEMSMYANKYVWPEAFNPKWENGVNDGWPNGYVASIGWLLA
jgi:hypothetical protein